MRKSYKLWDQTFIMMDFSGLSAPLILLWMSELLACYDLSELIKIFPTKFIVMR